MEHWCIKLWVDNKQALDKTSWSKIVAPKYQLCPESNFIADIIAVRIKVDLCFLGNHVHSHKELHQDEPTPLEVELNEYCDIKSNALHL